MSKRKQDNGIVTVAYPEKPCSIQITRRNPDNVTIEDIRVEGYSLNEVEKAFRRVKNSP